MIEYALTMTELNKKKCERSTWSSIHNFKEENWFLDISFFGSDPLPSDSLPSQLWNMTRPPDVTQRNSIFFELVSAKKYESAMNQPRISSHLLDISCAWFSAKLNVWVNIKWVFRESDHHLWRHFSVFQSEGTRRRKTRHPKTRLRSTHRRDAPIVIAGNSLVML